MRPPGALRGIVHKFLIVACTVVSRGEWVGRDRALGCGSARMARELRRFPFRPTPRLRAGVPRHSGVCGDTVRDIVHVFSASVADRHRTRLASTLPMSSCMGLQRMIAVTIDNHIHTFSSPVARWLGQCGVGRGSHYSFVESFMGCRAPCRGVSPVPGLHGLQTCTVRSSGVRVVWIRRQTKQCELVSICLSVFLCLCPCLYACDAVAQVGRTHGCPGALARLRLSRDYACVGHACTPVLTSRCLGVQVFWPLRRPCDDRKDLCKSSLRRPCMAHALSIQDEQTPHLMPRHV